MSSVEEKKTQTVNLDELIKKSMNQDQEPPFLLNIFINLLITFALSLSIYLLITNIFLTVYKINIQTSGQLFGAGGSGEVLFNNYNFKNLNKQLREHDEEMSVEIVQEKYYDCSSRNILNSEECDLINSYHRDYLNTMNQLRNSLESSSNPVDISLAPKQSQLKINTTIYVQ
jgi:hypothetical protein